MDKLKFKNAQEINIELEDTKETLKLLEELQQDPLEREFSIYKHGISLYHNSIRNYPVKILDDIRYRDILIEEAKKRIEELEILFKEI